MASKRLLLCCRNLKSSPQPLFSRCSQTRYIALDSQSEPAVDPIQIDKRDKITLIGLNRPLSRNAVNQDMARQLTVALKAFEMDKTSNVAVLHGIGDHFCAGYDLKELADNPPEISEGLKKQMNLYGAMGPTRLHLCKPVIAAVNGYAVAGGLELSLLCDIRVFEESAKVGVLNRRFGVPLIDGGTVRLPALIGLSNALDMILTGKLIDSSEAYRIGLTSRIVEDGKGLSVAVALANQIARVPQMSMRSDRNSAYYSVYNSNSKQTSLDYELKSGIGVIVEESIPGAQRFAKGEGRNAS